MFRRVDDNNCWLVRFDQTAQKMYLYEKISGVETEQGATGGVGITLTNGVTYGVYVSMVGSVIYTGISDRYTITYASAGSHLTDTGVKVDRAVTNLYAYPRTVSSSNFTAPLFTSLTTTTKSYLYASPTGTSGGDGTSGNPYDLVTALNQISVGGIVNLLAGVYTYDAINFDIPGTCTVTGPSSGKAIITASDGYPPSINIGSGVIVNNIWFGGTKFADSGSRFVSLYDYASMTNCTLWGYGQCTGGGGTKYRTYSKNRFVNCGYGTLYHDIYISAANVNTHDNISEGIHVGGAGYKIQCYHSPYGVTVHANFMGGSTHDLAIQGSGGDTITNNILWESTSTYWNASNCTFNKNIMGLNRFAFSDVTTAGIGNTATGNVFCNGQTTFGSSPQVWNGAAVLANLGESQASVDTAVSNLETKFANNAATVYADATIETDFAVLRTVVDSWKNQ
jgi:hypothetical protein